MAPRLPLVPFLAVATMFCVAAVCQDNDLLQPYKPSCYTAGNYIDGSQYQHNLDWLLRSLPTAASKYWFYNGTVGFAPDQVFGLIMCYADVSAKRCQDCLTRAPAGIREVCPYGRTVVATYDACLLRYSNENFFSVADLTVSVYRWIDSYVDDMASMGDARWKLMSQLAGDAAVSPQRIAINTLQYTDSRGNSQVMYGLAQCTRDLNTAECSRCLNDFVRILSDSRPNNTCGTVKGYSCYVAYQVGRDLGITLPPDGAPPPPSPRKKEGAPPARCPRKKGRKLPLVVGVPVGSVVFVSLISLLGLKEFISEVRIISRLRHRNLVQLIGWYHGEDDLILVYELMQNGSVDTHLYNPENLLTWPVRYKIALGVGSALSYLHQDMEPCVVHRDIKPSNVTRGQARGLQARQAHRRWPEVTHDGHSWYLRVLGSRVRGRRQDVRRV